MQTSIHSNHKIEWTFRKYSNYTCIYVTKYAYRCWHIGLNHITQPEFSLKSVCCHLNYVVRLGECSTCIFTTSSKCLQNKKLVLDRGPLNLVPSVCVVSQEAALSITLNRCLVCLVCACVVQCVSPHGGRHSVGSVLRTACGFPCLLEKKENEAFISKEPMVCG